MLPIAQQIEQGRLVCPVTRSRLRWEGERALRSTEGRHLYPIVGTAPILHCDQRAMEVYRSAGEGMFDEYAARTDSRLRRWLHRIATPSDDCRSPRSLVALAAVTSDQPPHALCLSVGGGPGRAHPTLTNLNIDAFQNVDVVADAYRLPYGNASVDAVHCEAVLEHLADPGAALAEIARVLAPGGPAYLSVPFLQAYHAYPGHYQNYTVEGLTIAATRAGLEIVDAGTCVGPTFALVDLIAHYFRTLVRPRWLGRGMWLTARIAGRCLIPLDRILNRSQHSHILASSVFCLARKADGP